MNWMGRDYLYVWFDFFQEFGFKYVPQFVLDKIFSDKHVTDVIGTLHDVNECYGINNSWGYLFHKTPSMSIYVDPVQFLSHASRSELHDLSLDVLGVYEDDERVLTRVSRSDGLSGHLLEIGLSLVLMSSKVSPKHQEVILSVLKNPSSINWHECMLDGKKNLYDQLQAYEAKLEGSEKNESISCLIDMARAHLAGVEPRR